MTSKNLEPIAIIGIGAIMPGALSKQEFWQNITAGKSSITEVPKTHWDPALFYDPDHKAKDKTYSKIGGFIQGFQFNSLKYRIPPQIAKQMDTVQCLAIETSMMALEDSGYDKKEFDRTRTAVIIGNAMGGIKQEYSNTRINRELYYDMIKKTPSFSKLDQATQDAIINETEVKVDEFFPPITEDTMPGELANVIAGRVANVLNVNGTNFTVDAACATSIAAADQAINGLRMGNYDMVICGGVDQMMSAAAFIKFSKIGALSADGSYAFDARANGFVMAEGAGMMILKRLSDAQRDGDNIYCTIRAIGASSDGKGKGITAPNPKGQKFAVEKCFEQLDYSPADVQLMEAHGTATKVGDKVEVDTLNETFGKEAQPGSIWLGSVKSQIGHAKAAAGVAAMIKVACAIKEKTLPPSINFETPNPNIDWSTTPFKVITKAQSWETGDKLRRGNISSFGFGGTNFHAALEEYNPNMKPIVKVANHSIKKEESTQNTQDMNLKVEGEKLQSDFLVFSADTKEELNKEMETFATNIPEDDKFLPKLSYHNHTQPKKAFAVAIVAENTKKLKEKIAFFVKTANTKDIWNEQILHFKLKGIYPFNPNSIKPKVGFIFPGQGSQYVDMMKDLASKYKIVQDTFDEADRILKEAIDTTLTEVIWSLPGESKEKLEERENAIKQTQMTQPAVLTADVAMMRLLSSFGIAPDLVIGHSLGEYAACVAAGVLDFPNGLKAVTTRAKAMTNIKVDDPGKMASIGTHWEKVAPELEKIDGYVIVANKNCPIQTVIAGEKEPVEKAVEIFTKKGIQSVIIPVSHAFHSEVVKPASPAYREFLNTLEIGVPRIPITSNIDAKLYPTEPEAVKDVMVRQLISSVEWMKQLEDMYSRGVRLFVECGPKRVMSALAASTLSDKKDIRVLSSNHPKKGGIVELNDLFANLTAAGIEVDWSKTDINSQNSMHNPAFRNWVVGEKKIEQTEPVKTTVEEQPMNNDSVVISGIAAGTPGSWDKVFRDGNLDEILQGKNLIEPISKEKQQKQIDKNIEYIVKSSVGNHRIEKLTSVEQAIKLLGQGGAFDLVKEFGLPERWEKSMDHTFKLAIGAGILALKNAGIPLVAYYKPTSTGSYLPDGFGLPPSMIDDTGVIFTTAFPCIDSVVKEVSEVLHYQLGTKNKEEIYNFYTNIIDKIPSEEHKKEVNIWFAENFAKYDNKNIRVFSQDFLLKVIPIAHSHFCQWIRAKGPATSLSGACSSTAQAISVAEDWLKVGRAKRVIIIGADDISNDTLQEWLMAGFLSSGAATREGEISKAAIPFDKRRNGMVIGMGAVGLVVEKESGTNERGMKPLAKLLNTEIVNSAFHPTRLDINHVSQVMDRLMSRTEKQYGLNRSAMAKEMVFISHETYTPARGGSASAEVHALKTTFKDNVKDVIVSNVKGFTGHTMGAGLEDVIAVHCLNTGQIPPIANYKEPDPELAGITLSQGGNYDFKYALRLAAGFGSQLAMTLTERMWKKGEPRTFDENLYKNWLKEISGQQNPEVEVVKNTLRVKDDFKAGTKPSVVMVGSQAFVDKATVGSAPVASAPAPTPAPVEAKPEPVVAPAPQPAPAVQTSSPTTSMSEEEITKKVITMIAEKTGYPEDMLEIDLDMEADLGIDTVKQAELFATMRDSYGINREDGLQLKDYPTIRHCVKFVMDNIGGTQASVPQPQPTTPSVQKSEPQVEKPITQPTATSTPAPTGGADEAEVTKKVVAMIAEKTGYPEDMLEIDLDMEADLGIDTVKQADLFATMRDSYGINREDGLQLKDYPTIRHCVKFVMDNIGGATTPAPTPAPTPSVQKSEPQVEKPITQPTATSTPAPTGGADEAEITKKVVSMIAEKTGYPEDMLEIDLDMEADLGIDTVKQAELFATMRDSYGINREDGLQLKDYPTIRHCVKFVMDNIGGAKEEAHAPTQEAPAPQPEVAPTPAPVEAKPETVEEAPVKESEENLEAYVSKKLRYVPTLVDAPLQDKADRKLSTERQVLIFGDNLATIKAHERELKDRKIPCHVFTSLKSRSKNTTIVNWSSLEETTSIMQDYVKENPGTQGIIYLLGANIKKFDKKVSAHDELTEYTMPLFSACRVFEKDLKNRDDADTFIAVATKIDGAFAYSNSEEDFNPIVASLIGTVQCLRKDMHELTGCVTKLIDFEPDTPVQRLAKTLMEEVINGDMRLMIATKDDKRGTILSLPIRLSKDKKHFDLNKDKTVILTGAGRSLGAMFATKIAKQYKAKLIILDIIDMPEKTSLWAKMNQTELDALKAQMWTDMKADTTKKATPLMLTREFAKITDAIGLYKTLNELKSYGSEVDYYFCDVLNKSMVKEVFTKIKTKHGKADVMAHFAGFEKSKLVNEKDIAEFYRTFDIKATSAKDFYALNIIKDSGAWVMISSIASKFGNLGQSDYAAANDYISKLGIMLHRKGIRAFSINMSALANIGMGIRPGVLEFLKSQGLEFVLPEDGMQLLLDELVYGKVPEIVLASTLGKLDWDKQLRIDYEEEIEGEDNDKEEDKDDKGSNDPQPLKETEEPEESKPEEKKPEPAKKEVKKEDKPKKISLSDAEHMLENVLDFEKDKMVSSKKTFSIEEDPYLKDHSIGGTPYVPGVMGIETFVELASKLKGKRQMGIEDVHFHLPIKLLRERPQEVRIKAEAKDKTVEMEIESDFINSKGIKMGNTRKHFTARVLKDASSKWGEIEKPKVSFKDEFKFTAKDIYKIYFHGPSFQVLEGIFSVDEKLSLGVFKQPEAPLWDEDKPLLAYPMLIEAMFQTCGFRDLHIENRMTLPDSIGKVIVHKTDALPERLFTMAIYRGKNIEGKSIYDAYAFDESGDVWLEIEDYHMIGQ
ncbi:MAG: SDR family oxidoreductase [Elusimicrobiaceae bacterium]|nr:SDR family oxidoreductase [Elusimicrobiaceae bacterium]